ncbi:MAG: PQQ-binding-like beta-propeller repeat protein [Sphingobacteriaceae bacterium]|nr:PQQ-binding-like beta-propeller repeat protein [Sphingobacteriaceae bacterium]
MKQSLIILLLIVCIKINAQTSPAVTWTFGINSACFGSAAAADLDNDGKKEIVFATYNDDGKVYCLNAENGSLNWSYNIGGCGDVALNIYDLDSDGQLDVFVNGSCNPTAFCIKGNTGVLTWSVASGGGDSPATIAEMDADGKPEIVFGNFSGQVRILNGEDGSLAKSVQVFTNTIQTDPVLVDANSDGKLDFIVGSYFATAGTYYLHCYDYTTATPIWTHTETAVGSFYAYHGGALADVDKDGKLEYVLGTNDGVVKAFNAEDGSVLWTKASTGGSCFGPVSIADVNADDTLDVIYHRLNTNTGIEVINGFNAKSEWNYPVPLQGSFRGSVVSDLNGNGKLDLVSSHYMGKVYAVEPFLGNLWTFDALSYFPTYPSTVPYISADNAPLVSDFDGDGMLDVFFVMGYGTYTVNQNATGKAFMVKGGVGTCPEWLMFRYDQKRSGYLPKADILSQCAVTGIKSQPTIESQIKIYPNPATNILNIGSIYNSKIEWVVVLDILGRKVLELKGNKSQINIEALEQGIYQLQIISEGKNYSSKFIKE